MPRTRRIAFFCLAVMIIAAGVLHPQVETSIDSTGGEYHIKTVFTMESPPDAVWKVLADYGNIQNFVSAVSLSRVKENRNGYILLEQEGSYHFLHIFPKKIRLLLEITEEKKSKISFKDLSMKDFEVYEGNWEITEISSCTRITYRLRAKPKFMYFGFITKGIFLSQAEKLSKEIIDEINKRSYKSRKSSPAK